MPCARKSPGHLVLARGRKIAKWKSAGPAREDGKMEMSMKLANVVDRPHANRRKWYLNMLMRRWFWWLNAETAEPEGEQWPKLLAEGRWQEAADLILKLRKGKKSEQLRQMRANELLTVFLARGWASLENDSALNWLRSVDQLNVKGFQSLGIEQFRSVADLIWEAGRAEKRNDQIKAIRLIEQALKACPDEQLPLKNRLNESLLKLQVSPTVETADELSANQVKNHVAIDSGTLPTEFMIITQSAGNYLVTTSDCFLLNHDFSIKNTTSVDEMHEFMIEMTRDEEGCWLMGAKACELICKGTRQKRLALMDGAEVAVGNGIQANFCQPVMETGTATLTFRSEAGDVLQRVFLLGQMGRVGGLGRPDLPLAGSEVGLLLLRQGDRLMARRIEAGGVQTEEFCIKFPCDLSVGREMISIKLAEAFDAPAKFFGQ